MAVDTLAYILSKFGVDPTQPSPISLSLSRHHGLPGVFAELGFTLGAEIGVEQGKYSNHLLRHVPNLQLWCVDPWQTYDRYKDHVEQAKLDSFYAEAQERLRGLNAVVHRSTSMDAVTDVPENLLDFVYIDGNHDFEFVVNDIIEWTKRVRPGGIVAGHDFKREGREKRPIPFHVIEAVTAYTSAYHIRPWFVLKGDKCPSWMFVKGSR